VSTLLDVGEPRTPVPSRAPDAEDAAAADVNALTPARVVDELQKALQAERCVTESLRAQLEKAAVLEREEEHELRAELTRLRDATVLAERADEQRSEVYSLQQELELARSQLASSTQLAERLMADNDHLTSLLNQQASLLDSVRESFSLRKQAAAVRAELGEPACEDACAEGCACEAPAGGPFRLPAPGAALPKELLLASVLPKGGAELAGSAAPLPAAVSPVASPGNRRPGLIGSLWNHIAGAFTPRSRHRASCSAIA
jgi:hypothetical protein